LVADEGNEFERRPLDNLEDDDDAVGPLLVLHFHIEEFARAGQQANIFFDDVWIEGLTDASRKLGQFFDASRVVPLDLGPDCGTGVGAGRKPGCPCARNVGRGKRMPSASASPAAMSRGRSPIIGEGSQE